MISNLILFLFLWVGAIGLNVILFAYLSARHRTSSYLIGAVATYIVLANILASKIIQIWKFIVPAGVVAYSMIFLINDILSEKYGKKVAKRGIYAGVIMNVMFIILIYLAILSPPLNSPDGLKMHENFKNVFNLTARIIIASIIAFLVSQSFNVLSYTFIKEKTRGRMLWLRNNVSTILAQFIDTVLFISIAFYGVLPLNVLYNMILTQYGMKVIIALLDTPFLYVGSWIYDKYGKK